MEEVEDQRQTHNTESGKSVQGMVIADKSKKNISKFRNFRSVYHLWTVTIIYLTAIWIDLIFFKCFRFDTDSNGGLKDLARIGRSFQEKANSSINHSKERMDGEGMQEGIWDALG